MTVSTRAALRATPPAMRALVAGAFINRFGAFVYVFLAIYLTQRGYTAPQAGLAIGAYSVGGLSAALLGGGLADQFGRRNTIVVSMCGSAASMLALSQAQGLPAIVLLAGVVGLAAELYLAAANALVADLVPEGQRVTGFALYRLATNAGSAAGPIVGGFLAGHSFFLLFLGDALTSLAFAGIALVAIPNHGVGDHAGRAQTREGVARAGWMRFERRFLLFLAATVFISFIYMQSYSTLGLQTRANGLPTAVYGFLLSLNGLLVIVAELPLTSLTRRAAPYRAMTAGTLLIAVGIGLIAFAPSVGLLALCVVIWTFGEMIHFPVAGAYAADLAPAHLRGRYAGARNFAWNAGMILGSVIGTRLFAWNAQRFWLLCGALGVVAALTIFVTQRPPVQPARAPTPPAAPAAR